MPALAELKLEVGKFRRWAARRPDARYLREIELAPCNSTSPDNCLLRGIRELPWGASPREAIRSLVQEEAPSVWPAKTTVRLFDFVGPVAQIDDREAEAELLSTEIVSPIWDDLRGLATDRQLGMIELNQLKRLMVPVMALPESGAKVDWVPAPESTLLTRLAFEGANEAAGEDW